MMVRVMRLWLCVALLIGCVVARTSAEDAYDAARADGKAFGNALKGMAQTAPQDATSPIQVPHYSAGASDPLGGYLNTPDALPTDGLIGMGTNEGARAILNSNANRIAASAVAGDLAHAQAIASDPLRLVSGYSGDPRDCREVPRGAVAQIETERLCNRGFTATQSSSVCRMGYVHTINALPVQICQSGPVGQGPACSLFDLSGCTLVARALVTPASGRTPAAYDDHYHCPTILPGMRQLGGMAAAYWCSTGGARPGLPACGSALTRCTRVRNFCARPLPRGGCDEWRAEYLCPSLIAGLAPQAVFQSYEGSRLDTAPCSAQSSNPQCTIDAETCVEPGGTRTINGSAVTLPCWTHERRYTCAIVTPGPAECRVYDDDPTCRFVREECLSDTAPCMTWERVYACQVSVGPSTPQHICDAQVYCADGRCEAIEHEVNDEFGLAATALQVAAQAQNQLDPEALQIFRGTRRTCAKTVFGIVNCCAPRGVPLIGGGCSAEDEQLKAVRDRGLCHYVGSYCASSVLGVCLQKKEAHCCYLSKLARILQEQGRAQLGLNFGEPKRTACAGFTIDQFSALDLSRMDFSEVESDFVSAARLPAELEAIEQLKSRVEDYYRANGH